jgi:uncharacterized phosphosugar-binding protein
MADILEQFHTTVVEQLQAIIDSEGDAIRSAAHVVAGAVAADKDFMAFGSGHSELVAREIMWRAGGLAPALAVHDHTSGDAERMEGIAKLILGHYTLREGGVMVVISNSGINPVPVEAAQIAKSARMTVVAITALQHSKAVPARHSSGQKLYEVADIVIDTHVPRGDTALTLPNSGLQTGPTSTLAGVFIMDTLVAQAAALLDERGVTPPLLVSANVPEGDTHNLALKQRYMPRMSRFPVDTADLTDTDT